VIVTDECDVSAVTADGRAGKDGLDGNGLPVATAAPLIE